VRAAISSSSLRVRVYAGIDQVTKKRHMHLGVVPAGPEAWREAEAVRERLLREVAEQRNARRSATIARLSITEYRARMSAPKSAAVTSVNRSLRRASGTSTNVLSGAYRRRCGGDG
jgi:hypothetical protein